ncbi:homocysteine S-methyltransferase [Paenibacillus turicensis]|uniref:homocysteine S-methyltransferase n=1 Tax=Paenibacillus turicensis TaxID=160487 RepID=UPI003D2B202B
MSNVIDDILQKYPIMILDGALATELEQHGCNLDDPLWSARVLLDRPEVIYDVHLQYFRAGADCAITSSYQATVEGFKRRGISEEQALNLIKKTVELAKQARDDFWQEWQQKAGEATKAVEQETRPKPIVAGSIGPYGAYMADGSEYIGHYGITDQQLADFHRPRMKALIEAGADILAMETIPSLQEAKVLVSLLEEFPEMSAWLSFSMKDEGSISEGTSLVECAQVFEDHPQIAAIGMNCLPHSLVLPAVQALSSSTYKPIIVYPNSGETYDATTKTWHQAGQECSGLGHLDAQAWYEAGANIIGGCCRTSPSHIEALAKEWRG